MNIIEFITKLFGNKAQKDMREIQPYVDQVKAVYPEIDALSNDELRARSQALMEKIAATVAPKKTKIAELRASIEELGDSGDVPPGSKGRPSGEGLRFPAGGL